MRAIISSILILLSGIVIHAQTAAEKQFPVGEQCRSVLGQLGDLHKETVGFYREKNYDKAYPKAKKMLEIAEANCVNEKDKRLSIALNLADIQVKREKKDESREIFEKNMPLAVEVFGENTKNFNDFLNTLIKLSGSNSSDEKFEQLMLKSVAVKKNVFGNESYETILELVRTASVFRKSQKYDEAEILYKEAIELSDKLESNEKIQKLAVANQYRAHLFNRYGFEEGSKKDEEFMKNRTQVYKNASGENILNGRAIKLFKPDYTGQAFFARADGEVKVEIVIGEDGKVIKAKAVSGHPYLIPSCEQAARATVFLPSYVDGEPIIVTGVIVYNFGKKEDN